METAVAVVFGAVAGSSSTSSAARWYVSLYGLISIYGLKSFTVFNSDSAFSKWISYLDKYVSMTRSMSSLGPVILKNFIFSITDSNPLYWFFTT